MARSDWIAIAAIVIASVLSSIQILLQGFNMRAAHDPAMIQTKQQTIPPKAKGDVSDRRKPRIARILMFLLNAVATYFPIMEIHNSNPSTRTSVVFIAAMVGVMVICFILPLVLGVYEYIENNF